ncbi:hypothetical protein GDO86_014502 [Hymenochirus boettgeri]|uniref:Uncharacterized protein n=1 Tax=Hymenochirus boettgeri TaxID=247094 RepID=A0A8T2JUA8_9PIPI|nr:hypothetical protein GDO86_014502 [Hymenochirus boettgeri]
MLLLMCLFSKSIHECVRSVYLWSESSCFQCSFILLYRVPSRTWLDSLTSWKRRTHKDRRIPHPRRDLIPTMDVWSD